MRLEDIHEEYIYEEKRRDLVPGMFQSFKVRSRSWIQPRTLSRGSDVRVKPEESGFWKLMMEVFQEGKEKQLCCY